MIRIVAGAVVPAGLRRHRVTEYQSAGGVEILVPKGLAGDHRWPADAPTLTVNGTAIFGAVAVASEPH